MAEEPKKKQQIKVEVTPDLQSTYANFAIINHNYNEIVLDFAHMMPNAPKTRVLSRVIMTPYHAKLLLNALQTNLNRYEQRFGEVKMSGIGMTDKSFPGFDPTNIQ